MTRWSLIAPLVANAVACCITCEGLYHAGVPNALLVRPGGETRVRFVDGSVVELPAMKEEMT